MATIFDDRGGLLIEVWHLAYLHYIVVNSLTDTHTHQDVKVTFPCIIHCILYFVIIFVGYKGNEAHML